MHITAYLDTRVTEDEVHQLQVRISGRDEVETVEFVSLSENRERNRKVLSEDLLEGLDEESIPAAPTITIVVERDQRLGREVRELADWVATLPSVKEVSDVELGMDKIRFSKAIVDISVTVTWAICLVLVIAAIFFVFSTIKLAVHARSDEIEILRLVGATPRFIRVPFYIEGVFQGLTGSIIAFVVVLAVHARLNAYIREEHLLDMPVNLVPVELVAWFFIGGITLGLAGSVFSVGRYLRG